MTEFPGNPDEVCPLDQQAVGWALHALEPDEEMAVLLHLPQCRSCQAAVLAAEEVLSAMGGIVEQVDPPPAVRESLLARAAETPQRRSAAHPRATPDTPPRRPVTPPGAPARPDADETVPTPVVRATPAGPPHGRTSWLSRRGRQLVAASLVLAAVLTIGGLAVRTSQLEQQRDAQTAQAQGVTDLLQRLGRPGTRYALLTTDAGSTVAAVIVAEGQRQVVPVGLPSNAADRDTYVLWGVPPTGGPQPLGTFDVTAADPTTLPVGAMPQQDAYAAYAISLEPGRVAPPTPSGVVASGSVAT